MAHLANRNPRVGGLPEDQALELAFITDEVLVRQFIVEQANLTEIELDAIRIERLRYHPGASCNVLLSLSMIDKTNDNRTQVGVYATAFSSNRFKTALHQAVTGPYRPGLLTERPLVDINHRVLLYEFPNDAGLSNLSLLRDNYRLHEVVSQFCPGKFDWINSDCKIERLRYKPENRFVGRLSSSDGGELVIRLETKEATRKLASRIACLNRLQTVDNLSVLALPLFCDEASGLIGMDSLPGKKLSESLQTSASAESLKLGIQALANLHSSDGDGLTQFDLESRIKGLTKFLAMLDNQDRELAGLARSLAKWLKAETVTAHERPTCLIHGDFHPGQIIIDGNGAYVIDLDRISVGPAEADMGNFLAQLMFLRMRGRLQDGEMFEKVALDTYIERSQRKLDNNQVLYWKVIGLVELAAKQFRRFKPDWQGLVTEILTKSQTEIERSLRSS